MSAATYLTSEQAVAAYAATFQPGAYLADLKPANRELRVGIDLYAHIWAQRAREFHVAVLSYWADLALQDAWQAARDDLIAAVCFEIAAAGAASDMARAA